MGAGDDPAVVRQAAAAGLVGGHRLAEDAAAARLARDGGHRDPRPVRGRLREADRSPLHGLARGGLALMRFSVLVEISLRAGIADPQGATIERALPALGFEAIHGVRAGK